MNALPTKGLSAGTNDGTSVTIEVPEAFLEIAREGNPANRRLTLTRADVAYLYSLCGGQACEAPPDAPDTQPVIRFSPGFVMGPVDPLSSP